MTMRLNDLKSFYLELRDLFIKLIRKTVNQCLFYNDSFFTETWNKIAKNLNDLTIKIEVKNPNESKKNLFKDIMISEVLSKTLNYELYYSALQQLLGIYGRVKLSSFHLSTDSLKGWKW